MTSGRFGGQRVSLEGIVLQGNLWKFEPDIGAWSEVGTGAASRTARGKPVPLDRHINGQRVFYLKRYQTQ